ncbi:MAG: flagellar motor protein MotB [Deltaproteobacteria bacterium]|nr:flagellar motor protein MotB [Deltaproteobacteria bacterium]
MAEESRQNKRENDESEGGGTPAWLTTYCDLMTLMLSFFVILVSFSTFEEGRIVKLVGSFRGAFKILPGGFKTDPGEEVIEPGKEMLQTFRESGEILTRMRGVVEKDGLNQGVELMMTDKGFEVFIDDYVLFGLEPGKADIVPEMEPFLDELAEIILQKQYVVRIEGHTDDLSVGTEKFPSSWELSTARAVNILRYFVARGGISPLRLSAAGFGKYLPLFPNDTPEHRAKNRRVMIHLEQSELAEKVLEKEPLFKKGVVKDLSF